MGENAGATIGAARRNREGVRHATYTRRIGRVGALALALGVGLAITGTPGIALADGPSGGRSGQSAQTADTSASGTSSGLGVDTSTESAADPSEGETPTTVGTTVDVLDDIDDDIDDGATEKPAEAPEPDPAVPQEVSTDNDPESSLPESGDSATTAIAPDVAVDHDTTQDAAEPTQHIVSGPAPSALTIASAGIADPALTDLLTAKVDEHAVSAAAGMNTIQAPAPPRAAVDRSRVLVDLPARVVRAALDLFATALSSAMPKTPGDNPLLWGLLAWVRRQTEWAFAAGPTLGVAAPVFTTSAVDGQALAAGERPTVIELAQNASFGYLPHHLTPDTLWHGVWTFGTDESGNGYGTLASYPNPAFPEVPGYEYQPGQGAEAYTYMVVALEITRGPDGNFNVDPTQIHAIAAKPLAVGDTVYGEYFEDDDTVRYNYIYVYKTADIPQSLIDLPNTLPTPPAPGNDGGDGGGDGGGGNDGGGNDGGGNDGGGNDGGGNGGGGPRDPRNPEWEERWEAFQTITSGFPIAGIGVSLIGAAIDGGQLGLAIARGDWADVRDEIGDITGSLVGAAVGFIPGANLASGVVGSAVGKGVTGVLDGLFG